MTPRVWGFGLRFAATATATAAAAATGVVAVTNFLSRLLPGAMVGGPSVRPQEIGNTNLSGHR